VPSNNAVHVQEDAAAPATKTRREFTWLRSKAFTGWICKGCHWVQPDLRFAPGDKTPLQAVEEAFEQHKCEDYAEPPSYARARAIAQVTSKPSEH